MTTNKNGNGGKMNKRQKMKSLRKRGIRIGYDSEEIQISPFYHIDYRRQEQEGSIPEVRNFTIIGDYPKVPPVSFSVSPEEGYAPGAWGSNDKKSWERIEVIFEEDGTYPPPGRFPNNTKEYRYYRIRYPLKDLEEYKEVDDGRTNNR